MFRYLTISSHNSGFRNGGIEASRSLAVGFADIASTRFAQMKSPTEEAGGLALMIVEMIVEIVFSTSRSLALSALLLDVVIQGYQGVVGTLEN